MRSCVGTCSSWHVYRWCLNSSYQCSQHHCLFLGRTRCSDPILGVCSLQWWYFSTRISVWYWKWSEWMVVNTNDILVQHKHLCEVLAIIGVRRNGSREPRKERPGNKKAVILWWYKCLFLLSMQWQIDGIQ